MVSSPYAYGSIAATDAAFVLSTPIEPRSWRLFLVVRLVKMWRLPACERLTEPLPRTRKRFLAPDFVFIFGICNSLFAAHSGALARLRRRARGFVALRRTGLGLVRVMRFRERLLGSQQHHHLPAFHPRERFDDGVRLQVVADPLEQPDAELLVRHFAAAETQRDLRLVAFAEKSDQVAKLDLVVAFIGPRPEFHFLDLDLLQLELCLVLLFCFAVLELAEIHDPAHRRLRRRRDFDQIKLRRFRSRDGVRQAYNAKLLAFDSHQSNFGRRDFTVDPLLLFQGQCR